MGQFLNNVKGFFNRGHSGSGNDRAQRGQSNGTSAYAERTQQKRAGASTSQACIAAHAPIPNDDLFSDAVQTEVFGSGTQRTHNTMRERVKQVIRDNLMRRPRHANGEHATNFAAIRHRVHKDADGAFLVRVQTPHTEYVVPRTQEEVTLHVLLQSELRKIGAIGPDTGDTLDFSVTCSAIGHLPEPGPSVEPRHAQLASARSEAGGSSVTARVPEIEATALPDESMRETQARALRPTGAAPVSNPAQSTTARRQQGRRSGSARQGFMSCIPSYAPSRLAPPPQSQAPVMGATKAMAGGPRAGHSFATAPSPAPAFAAPSHAHHVYEAPHLPGAASKADLIRFEAEAEAEAAAAAALHAALPRAMPMAKAASASSASMSAAPRVPEFRPPLKQENVFVPAIQETTYFSDTVNMPAIDRCLHGRTHDLKEIAGANADCWWRAGWAAVALQHRADPARLERLITDNLGPDYAEEAKDIRSMAEACRANRTDLIFTGPGTANGNTDKSKTPSRLMIPGKDANDSEDTHAERTCRKLTKLFLARAGLDESCYADSVERNVEGDFALIGALLTQLDASAVVFSRPWKSVPGGARQTPDYAQSVVQVCPRQPGLSSGPAGEESPLHDLPHVPERESCTDSLLSAVVDTPVLIHQGRHYNLAIPKGMQSISAQLLETGDWLPPTHAAAGTGHNAEPMPPVPEMRDWPPTGQVFGAKVNVPLDPLLDMSAGPLLDLSPDPLLDLSPDPLLSSPPAVQRGAELDFQSDPLGDFLREMQAELQPEPQPEPQTAAPERKPSPPNWYGRNR